MTQGAVIYYAFNAPDQNLAQTIMLALLALLPALCLSGYAIYKDLGAGVSLGGSSALFLTAFIAFETFSSEGGPPSEPYARIFSLVRDDKPVTFKSVTLRRSDGKMTIGKQSVFHDEEMQSFAIAFPDGENKVQIDVVVGGGTYRCTFNTADVPSSLIEVTEAGSPCRFVKG